jgi:hypothetical protein
MIVIVFQNIFDLCLKLLANNVNLNQV